MRFTFKQGYNLFITPIKRVKQGYNLFITPIKRVKQGYNLFITPINPNRHSIKSLSGLSSPYLL